MNGMNNSGYYPNGGQAFYPPKDRPPVPSVPYEAVKNVDFTMELKIHPKFEKFGYVLVDSPEAQFLEGITPEMLDWFWANMEKCYFLWAPGVHAGFAWNPSPAEVGYVGSCEFAYEFDLEHPLGMTRQSMENYPFTECYEHCWLSNRPFKGGKEGDRMWLIHMYKAVPGGTEWTTVRFIQKDILEAFRSGRGNLGIVDPREHTTYEASRFKYFLPQLYALWKGHPDPWQNPQFDLRTKKNEDGTWAHICDNLPPHLKNKQA